MASTQPDVLAQILAQGGEMIAMMRNLDQRIGEVRRELSKLQNSHSQMENRLSNAVQDIVLIKTRLVAIEGPVGDLKKVRLIGAVALWIITTLSTVAIAILTIATDTFGLFKGHH